MDNQSRASCRLRQPVGRARNILEDMRAEPRGYLKGPGSTAPISAAAVHLPRFFPDNRALVVPTCVDHLKDAEGLPAHLCELANDGT